MKAIDEIMLRVLYFLSIIFLIIVFLFFCWAVIDTNKSTFELKKDDWNCTDFQERKTTQLMFSGKIAIPVLTNKKMCVAYKMKDA